MIVAHIVGLKRMKMGVKALLMVACALLAVPLAAQQRGPLPPPPPGTVVPSSVSWLNPKTHSKERQSPEAVAATALVAGQPKAPRARHMQPSKALSLPFSCASTLLCGLQSFSRAPH